MAQYPDCAHLSRKEINVSDDDVLMPVTFDVLPIYEKELSDVKQIKHYSLLNNELLKCRWESYKNQFPNRKFAPFQFPDIRDYHFYNYQTRLISSQSIHKKGNYRMSLIPGPGVDLKGQMPIPNELIMKKKKGIHKIFV